VERQLHFNCKKCGEPMYTSGRLRNTGDRALGGIVGIGGCILMVISVLIVLGMTFWLGLFGFLLGCCFTVVISLVGLFAAGLGIQSAAGPSEVWYCKKCGTKIELP
jgi:hypothetical protein